MMANSSSMSRPKSYDDDEGLLQDQGLEVVVLPYQPPPPPPPPRTTRSGEGISKTGLRRPAALSSTPPPPPPPPRPSSLRPHDKFGKFGKSSPRPEFDIPDEDGTSAPMSVGDAYSGGGVGRSNLGDGFSSPVGGAPTPRSRWVMEEAARCHHPQHPQHLEQDVGETSGRKQPLSPVSQARKDGSPREGCQPHVRSHSVPVAHSHCSQGASAGTAASLARATSCVADHPNSQFRESGRDGGTGDQSSKSSSKQLHHSNNTKNNTKNNSNNNNNTNNTKNNNNPNNKPKKSKQKSHDKLSYLQMAKLGYQELIHAIIRPPRSSYPIEALGPKEFRFCNATIRRRDFVLVNERGLGLHCCLWRRVLDWDDDEEGVEEEYEFGGDRDGVDGVREQPPPRSQQQQEPQQQKQQHQDDVVFSSSSSSSLSRSNLGDDTYGYGERAEHDDDAWGIEQYLNKQQFKPVSPPDIPGNSNAERGNNSKTNNSRTDHDRSSSNPTNSHRRLDPVVVYLHGNSSSRVEVLPQLSHLLSLGVAVLSFDFAGSGHSEGDYVSLGYYEREDLQTVISHLRASGNFSHIALWGRSMGAATALMYGSRDPTVSCMVLDSPFTDLTRLAEEMVEKGREQGVAVPNFVLTVIMRMIKSSVKHQAGFNIKHISPISHVGKCFIPAMFVAGEHDDFIHKRHSELLHEKYAGDKNLVIVDGDHNSPRPRFLLQSACLFLQSCMRLPASLELVVPLGANLLAPPWMLSRSGLGVAPSLRGRAWLPSDAGRTKDGKQGKKDGNHPPQLPFDGKGGQARKALVSKEKEANADASAACLAAGAPPDMSKRQKEIQSSLFKMLGQDD